MKLSRSRLGIAVVMVALGSAVGCGGKVISEEPADAAANPGPVPIVSPPTASGVSPLPAPPPPPDAVDAGVIIYPSPPAEGTLYERLGSAPGITAFLEAVFSEVLMDPQQASYFSLVGTAGHPTFLQMEKCFEALVGSATGGPETYPPTLADGYVCRDLTTAHAGLHIPLGIFNDFVATIIKTAIASGVSQDDVATIGALLQSTQPMIVN